VEIEHKADGERFVIERLGRGCILNQRGFLFADSNDTNARCASFVSVFALEIDDLEAIRE
jgi:CRP-like cAMP-binding protein